MVYSAAPTLVFAVFEILDFALDRKTLYLKVSLLIVICIGKLKHLETRTILRKILGVCPSIAELQTCSM